MSKLTIERVAQLCHTMNAEYCAAIGDYSQRPWLTAPDWQKQSAIEGVKFRLANAGAHPSTSHDAWLKHKIADGWRHGPVKDEQKKEHPCCVPYDELPPEQKAKDFLFCSIVESLRLNGLLE